MIWTVVIGAATILGSLGLFLYGMKVMSDGLQQVAGNKMRQILSTMTTNKYTGVLTGFTITSILQSSSATTVMTVSFVNAGLLTLMESAGVMMGANIGTTITGWLVSMMGVKVSVASFAIPLITIGLPLLFSSKQSTKKWGEVIIGFAILFLGLDALKDSVPDLRQNEQVLAFIQQFSNPGILTRIFFVFIGAAVTIIMQSSSAAMALTIALTLNGFPIDIAAAMILGENIGTTITAELASLVANTSAKRSARIHSLFNLVGVAWMVILAPYVLDLIAKAGEFFFQDSGKNFILAGFHTTFNLINVLILLPFVKQIVYLAEKTVKGKGEAADQFSLEYLQNRIINTSDLSVAEASKEVEKFGMIILRMNQKLNDQLKALKEKERSKINKDIHQFELLTDNMEEQITHFLTKVSESSLKENTSRNISQTIKIITNMERAADIIKRASDDFQRRDKDQVRVDSEHINHLINLVNLMTELLTSMNELLGGNVNGVFKEKFKSDSKKIKSNVKFLREGQLNTIEKKSYNIKSGIIYRDIYTGIEKLNDHIFEICNLVISTEEA